VDHHFDEQLVEALADLVRGWNRDPAPEWVTWIPSLSHTDLVPDFARRLAGVLALPAVEAVTKTRHTEPQKTMQNSAQQLANVWGAFAVSDRSPSGPVLLVDDIVDSRWTMTYVGCLLRQAGCTAVVRGREAIEATRKVAHLVAGAGLPVISGGAKGVDAISMAASYEAGGSVIGVLADSLERAIGQADNRRAMLDGRACL
jgi:DNA recombination-mediator protein A